MTNPIAVMGGNYLSAAKANLEAYVQQLQSMRAISATNHEIADLYATSVFLYATVNFWADAVSGTDFLVSHKGVRVDPEHPLQKLLNSRGDMYRRSEVSRMMWGRNLLWKRRNLQGRIYDLRWINPTLYAVDAGRGGLRGFRVYPGRYAASHTDYIKPQDAIYTHEIDFQDDFDGIAAAEVAFLQASAETELATTALAWFRHNMFMSGIFQPAEGANIDDKKVNSMIGLLKNLFQGAMNAGRSLVQNARWEYIQIQQDFDKVALSATYESIRQNVSIATNVPVEFVTTGQANYAEIKGKIQLWYQLRLKPVVGRMADAFAQQLAIEYGDGYTVEADITPLMISDPLEQAELVEKKLESMVIDLYGAQKELGVKTPDLNLKGLYRVNGIPVPSEHMREIWQYQLGSGAAIAKATPMYDVTALAQAQAPMATANTLAEKYDPNQPRDEDGKFGSGGGSSSGGDKPDKPKAPEKPKKGKPDWAKKENRTAGKDPDGYQDYGNVMRNPKNAGANDQIRAMSESQVANLDKKQQNAVTTYTGESYQDINGGLRGQGKLTAAQQRTVDNLDTALSKNSLSEDTVLYRGMRMSPELESQLTTGSTFTDNAYTSASFDQTMGDSFARGALMRIKAPAGTNGLSVAAISNFPPESEFLLPRNTSYRITGVSKDSKGQFFIDAEIIGSDGKSKSVRYYFGSLKQEPEQKPEQDRSDKFSWGIEDIVFDEPETPDDDDDNSDSKPETGKSNKTDKPGSAYAYIPLANNADVLRVQRQLKERLTDERIEWQIPLTFHVTLCFADKVTDAAIDQISRLVNFTAFEMEAAQGEELAYFDTPDGKALHIPILNTNLLDGLQASVYRIFEQSSTGLSEFSIPENYNPHITLAYLPSDVDFNFEDYRDIANPLSSVLLPVEQVIVSRDNYDPALVVSAAQRIKSARKHFIPDDQYKELKDWRQIAQRKGEEYPFEARVLPEKAVKFITWGLSTDAALDDVFTAAENLLRQSLDETWLTDSYEAVQRAEKSDAVKAIEDTRARFVSTFTPILRELDAGTLTSTRAQVLIHAQLERFERMAYLDGLVSGGIPDAQMTLQDFRALASLTTKQKQFASQFISRTLNDGIGDVNAKAHQWFNGSVYPFFIEGQRNGKDNPNERWDMNPALENCDSCIKLDKQVHRRSSWNEKGIYPNSNKLICGKGNKCGCKRTVTAEKAHGRFLSASLVAAEHAH